VIAAVLALVVLAPAAAADAPCAGAAEAVRFGDWLAAHEDYYRAIGEYERATFLGSGRCAEEQVTLRIGRAYALGEQGERAAEVVRDLARGATDRGVRGEATLVLAYARLRAGDAVSAVALARSVAGAEPTAPVTGRSRILAAVALLREPGCEREAAREVGPVERDPALAPLARDVARTATRLAAAPRKSPALAGALSAVVPGLGHAYLGEPGTALTALAVNAVFAWATVDALRDRRYGLGAAALAIESLWYGGAIFGAVAGAHRYNRDARALPLEELEAGARLERELLPPPPALYLRAGAEF